MPLRVLTAFDWDRAVDCRTAGYAYQQVANERGYASRGTAYNVVAKALRLWTAEVVTVLPWRSPRVDDAAGAPR